MSNNDAKYIIETMGTAARINRLKAADYFIQHPERISDLVALVFDTSYKFHHKAAWVLEFVLKEHLNWIITHIDLFSSSLSKLKNDSAIRPIAKICQWIAYEYVHNRYNLYFKKITVDHIDNIIESSFDWMIGDYKVASKVYSMDTLYYFGSMQNEDYSWVLWELKNIILQNINEGSPGYKSHGKKILTLLNQ